MLLTLFAFILWIPAILGAGNLGHLLYKKTFAANHRGNLLENAIIGLAIISAIANLLNFFTAITLALQLMIWLVGFTRFLYILVHRKIKPTFFLLNSGLIWGIILIFLRANKAPGYYDTGYYGLQTLLWYNASSLPLGLANLHARFAYNSSWLGLASVIQIPNIDYFFSGEILRWYMSFMTLYAVQSLLKKQISITTIYGLLITLVLLTPVLGTFTISALSTDLPVFWITLMLGWISVRLLEQKISPTYAIWLVANLTVFSITIKLSAMPIFLVLICISLVSWKNLQPKFASLLKAILPITLLMVIPWLARFFWMTGCLVYPVAFTCLPSVQWRVPVDSVQWMANYIKQFAINRNLFPQEMISPWFADGKLFQDWIALYSRSVETFVLISFAILGLTFYLISIKNCLYERNRKNEMLIIVPYVAGIFFWFLTAPDIRFGAGYIWTTTLILLSIGIFYWLPTIGTRTQNLTLAFLQIAMLGVVVIYFARVLPTVTSFDKIYWQYPASSPNTETHLHSIDDVNVRTPVKSDLLCWGEPLPCTPELHPNLRIQTDDKGQIKMFYIELDK